MRKRPVICMIALFALIMLVSGTNAQTPVEPVDLEAVSIAYTFPAPDSIIIFATFNIYYSDPGPASYATDIECWLGSNLLSSKPITISSGGSICSSDTTCSKICDIQTTGAQIQYVHCSIWYTWTGPGCDPNDPPHTCQPLEYCACGAQATATFSGSYNGEATITVAGDPNLKMNEADETNNTMMVGSVPAEKNTWGTIKASYEK